jgi:hypothetical protein
MLSLAGNAKGGLELIPIRINCLENNAVFADTAHRENVPITVSVKRTSPPMVIPTAG